MYRENSIAVIIPSYNEEKNISSVINTIPDFIDEIIVVDDCSIDDTRNILEQLKKKNVKLTTIFCEKNGGSGAAKREGYIYARNTEHQIFITMDGDGQMDPDEINSLIDPIIDDKADFTKANRLLYGDIYNTMPRYRFWGNAVLTLLTKIASGYWHVTDAQTGYTACNRKVISRLPIERLYTDYGYPNHLLVMLNVCNFRVKDVPSKPIYGVGEVSNIKVRRVIFKISWLILKIFFWRLKEKYVLRDFHPLVFFYIGGFLNMFFSILLTIRMFSIWISIGRIPSINALAVVFFGLLGMQLLMFAMWFDMEANKDLKVK